MEKPDNAQIQQIFMELTRYPAEILGLDADLEDDLGIDSVKRGEIFAVFRERFHLPETLDVPQEKMRTIRGITDVLRSVITSSNKEILIDKKEITDTTSLDEFTSKDTVHIDQKQLEKSLQNSSQTKVPFGDKEAVKTFKEVSIEQKLFSGKIAFVTGSGHGLGKAIASRLAEMGAFVIINTFHSRFLGDETVSEIISAGGQAVHLWGSVANLTHLDKIFDEIESKFGVLDFFISNASNGILAPLTDVTEAHWEKAFRTNIIGLNHGAMRSIRLMKKSDSGRIITLSSPGANRYIEYFGCMGTIKAAVESLTRSLAVELAPYNITVNCIAPSAVYGELLSKYPDKERLIPLWESRSIGKRLCKPEDVADAVVFLLSEKANFITGTVFVVDGGLSLRGF